MAKGKALQAIVEIAGSISPTLGKSIEEATGKLDGLNLKAIAVGAAVGGIAVATGKAIIEAGAYLADLGDEYNQAMNDLSATTGATGEDLEALGEVVKDVYGDNFGESMGDAAASVAEVERVLDLTGDALAGATKDAIALSDTFEYDIGESTRAASALMKNFGIEADEAYNLIAYGAQNGADQNGDLIDTLNEYSAQYSALGLSADQFVQGLVTAGDKGVFSIDKVGDAVKEFNIRSKDLSESSAAAYETLGMNADEMFKRFAAGGDEANAAFFEVVQALEEMDDPLKKNEAAVQLFGTMYEDLGEDILPILSSMEGATLENIDALEQINKVKYNDLGSALEGIKRQAEVALLPLATTIANSLMEIAPLIGDALEGILPAIEEMTSALIPIIDAVLPQLVGFIQELIPIITEIASTLLAQLIPPIVEIMASLIPVIIELLRLLAPVLTELITAILPVIVSLIQKLLPVILKIVQAVLPVLTKLLNTILPLLMDFIEQILSVVLDLIDALLPLVMAIIDAVLPVIIELLNILIPMLAEILSAILPVIIELINALLPIVTQIIDAVLPILIEILGILTPILDLIIQLLGPILELFMMLLQPILDLIVMAIGPLIEIFGSLISGILEPIQPILTFLASLFSEVLGGAIQNIQPIIDNLMLVFGGLIDFISGVFSGNWEQAWDGIVSMFKGIFNMIPSTVEAVINGAIDLINGIIKGINSVAEYVGLEIGLIPHVSLPRFAAGGFTEGISIAGEAGTEAIISFDPAYREANIGYWLQAGEMLGLGTSEETATSAAGRLLTLDDFSLSEMAGGQTIIYYDFSGFTWSPTFGGASEEDEDLMAELRDHEAEFFDWLEEWLRIREEGRYCRA